MNPFVIALVVVSIIVILVSLIPKSSGVKSVEQKTEVNLSGSQTGSITVESFSAPSVSEYVDVLMSRTWNALVTTYRTPGSPGEPVSGKATFQRENGEELKLSVDSIGDSLAYDFDRWKLNSNMRGFTMSYKDRSGDRLYASIEKRGPMRYDISIYDTDNNLKRYIVIA